MTTGTLTLADFLLARIDEDEAAARAASPSPWVWNTYSAIFSGPLIRPYDEWTEQIDDTHTLERRGQCPGCGREGCALRVEDVKRDPLVVHAQSVAGDTPSKRGEADLEHIARHDPARVLAECEAKRRIVEEWVSRNTAGGWYPLACLALPYAEHPDYREEWRP